MISRRNWLRVVAGAGAAMAFEGGTPSRSFAHSGGATVQTAGLIKRAIPSSGEELPVIGLGGANTFSAAARAEGVRHDRRRAQRPGRGWRQRVRYGGRIRRLRGGVGPGR